MDLRRVMFLAVIIVLLWSGLYGGITAWKYFIFNIDRDLYDKGVAQLSERNLEGAIDTFSVMVERKPLHFFPRFILANLYLQNREYDKAINLYERLEDYFAHNLAELSKPSQKNVIYPLFYFNLGDIYSRKSRLQDAAQAYRKIIKAKNFKKAHPSEFILFYPRSMMPIDEFYAEVHYELGVVYVRLGERDAALEQYRELLKLDRIKAEKLNNLISI